MRETWRLSPPSRHAQWNDIFTETNAKKREEIKLRTHKICSTCKILKALEDFAKNIAVADGRATVCLECRREYDRVRYENKGTEIRARVKRYRNANLPKVNAADNAKLKKRKH